MVDTAVPTYQDQRWGPNACDKFDYWQNPTRVTGGNPLIIYRHAGADNQSYKALRSSADEANYYFFQWLLGADSSTEPSEHWDVCSVSAGQQKHKTSDIVRSLQMFAPDTIRDHQRCIVGIKSLNSVYGFNPKKVHGFGSSHGAMMMGLSQLHAPIIGRGGQKTGFHGKTWLGTYDSTLRSCMLAGTVVDVQNYSGVDRFHFTVLAPIFGVSTVASTEWDNVDSKLKAACSIIQFFVNRDLAHYPGFFSTYVEAGDHIYPIGDPARTGQDPHDSIQHTNLVAAMEAAGVEFGQQLITSTSTQLTNSAYGAGGTSSGCLRTFRERAIWLSTQNAKP